MRIASELQIINLDDNASARSLPQAKQALVAALELEGNASSTHVLGKKQRLLIDDARAAVAVALGGQENELFFCSGASEGNRWLIDALARTGKARGKPFTVLISPLEHPSMMKCAEAAALRGEILLEKLAFDHEEGEISQAEVLIVTAAHNETGYIPDLERISGLISPDCILICDAAQAVGRVGLLPKRVDAIIASSHKMGGVVGAGAVLLRGQARKLSSPWAGGGQEAGLRPGSEAVPLIAAMGQAASQVNETRIQNQDLQQLRDQIEHELLSAWPGSFVVGSGAGRLPQTSAICVMGVDPEALRIAVNQSKVCVGFGSACSALAPEPSPALLAFGLSPSQARATIRISLSPQTPVATIWEGVGRIKDLVRGMIVEH